MTRPPNTSVVRHDRLVDIGEHQLPGSRSDARPSDDTTSDISSDRGVRRLKMYQTCAARYAQLSGYNIRAASRGSGSDTNASLATSSAWSGPNGLGGGSSALNLGQTAGTSSELRKLIPLEPCSAVFIRHFSLLMVLDETLASQVGDETPSVSSRRAERTSSPNI